VTVDTALADRLPEANSDQKQTLVHVYDSMTVSSDLEFWSKRVQALSGQISYFGIGVLFHHLFQQFHINFFPDGLFANLGIRTTDFWEKKVLELHQNHLLFADAFNVVIPLSVPALPVF
jgi:hypothetical protein